jgi:Zn-dependent peptidase ImmA (M78 family)
MVGLDSEPVAIVPELAESFGTGVRTTPFEAANERMLVAVAKGGAPIVTILRTGRTTTPWGQRFEQARGLGHAVLDPLSDGALGAASSPYAQQRRRMRSGAFAAELLLPASAVEKASAGHLDGARPTAIFAKVMKQYGVGARTAAHQLFTHGWLSSPAVRDELIDEHAAQ